MARAPKIPQLLDRKIYKTGQTRGADDDQIYQNRVGRSSTVLIPFSIWQEYETIRDIDYDKGFIVLISPEDFFENIDQATLTSLGLEIGSNCLVFYEKRDDWHRWNPDEMEFEPAQSRVAPLLGQYVARVANTTAVDAERINVGFTSSGMKGAGIRLYEYANRQTISECRIQLEALFWHSVDFKEIMLDAGMTADAIAVRRDGVLEHASQSGLLDYKGLVDARILNSQRELVCPLCLSPISAAGFLSRLPQASGRERHDLTVTEINLFHINELKFGEFNHSPYNLGWGHHHCNVVCKDAGIQQTLDWMTSVLDRNQELIVKEG